MKDELKARFEELYSPEEVFPERILGKYEPVSCLKYSDRRRVYLFREKIGAAKVIVKCGEGENGELLKREYNILRSADAQTAQFFPAALDYFCEGGTHYYVREYAEGITLDELVRVRGVLPPMEARAAAAEICRMVHRLHRAKPPIICRDIKPENLIACPDGKYRIIDLDAARYIKEDVPHDTRLLGTQDNAAPEQYGYRQSDKRTDVYALGMVLLFLASGGYDKNAVTDEGIRKIVNRCTEFYPYRRFANAEALRRALLGKSPAARVGFAASFAAAGAAAALAVTLLLPNPAELSEPNKAAPDTPPAVTEAAPSTEPSTTEAAQTSEPVPATEKPQIAQTPPVTEKPQIAQTPPEPTTAPDGSVVFAEPRIEKAVRLHLGLRDSEPITEEHLGLVKSIVIDGDGYFKSYEDYQQYIWDGGWMYEQDVPYMDDMISLSDIPMMTNLESLVIIKQDIESLPDMSGTALKNLQLNWVDLVDISGIANCTGLETVNLACTPLVDISPLSGLKNITIAHFATTYVEDISALKGAALTELSAGSRTYVDPQTLASFKGLFNLNICNVDDKVLAAIKQLPELCMLMVYGDIPDMTAFSDMKNLTEIQIGMSDKFVSMEGVQSLKKLQYINVSSTALKELPKDLALPRLESINLAYTAVTDFTPLLNCPRFNQLLLSEDQLPYAQAQLGEAGITLVLQEY